jgi:signal transduction histidine kinase
MDARDVPHAIQELREVPLFRGLSDEQLRWVIDHGRELPLPAGAILFRDGDAATGLYVLLGGELRVTKQIGGQEVLLGKVQRGAFVGEISLMTGSPHTATVQAGRDSRCLRFDTGVFRDVVNASPILAVMLSTMAERLRANEILIQQHEKLAALGKLSAGLAHELNNPAAAAQRAARQLREMVESQQALAQRLAGRLDPVHLDACQALRLDAAQRSAARPRLDPLTQSDREEQVAAWLEAHQVPDGWQLAPALVNAGLDTSWLDGAAAQLGGDSLAEVLTWVTGTLSLKDLLDEVERSTARIAELVRAVKSYSHMDQAPVGEVNVNQGLDDTLVILRHKLGDGITVTRDYDPELPRITAYGSELNQVWTNILDNAVDALQGKGRITVRTARDGDSVLVEIADDGPGIPPEIQSRIFEPFFTTKAQGKGTGLGLDIAYRTVVDRHDGDLRITSQPGATCFQIRLPIRARNPVPRPDDPLRDS